MARIMHREARMARISKGMHNATIAQIVEEKQVEGPYGLKDRLTVTFEVEGSLQPVEVRKRYNASIHPKSAFAGLIESVTGILPGEEFDIDSLEGMECQVLITHRQDDQGNVWENIESVLADD